LSINHAFGRLWPANAPYGLRGIGTSSILDPTGIPLAGAPNAQAGGVFAGDLTPRLPTQLLPGALNSGAVGTAFLGRSHDGSGRAVFMTKPVGACAGPSDASRYSGLSKDQQAETLRACRELTGLLFDGLDLEREIRAVQQHKLGDTVLLWNASQLRGFAVCHYGSGTEGGDSCCYVKFAVARPGPDVAKTFERLLDACEALAAAQALPNLEAGVNLACDDAYRRMRVRGFRTGIQGVAMHKPNEPAYHRPDVYVIDDRR
jgi:hypothetical protein